MFDLSKRSIKINCPECKKALTVDFRQVANEETITCLGCSRRIKLVDDNKSVQKGLKDINKAFADFEKTLRSFGK